MTPYRCDVPGCGKYFTRRFNMKSHMRWHTGACPFVCPYDACDARFKWKSSFASHIRSHRQHEARQKNFSGGNLKMRIAELLDAPSPDVHNLEQQGNNFPGSPGSIAEGSHYDDTFDNTGFQTILKVLEPPISPVPVKYPTEETVLQRTHVRRESISCMSSVTTSPSPPSFRTADL